MSSISTAHDCVVYPDSAQVLSSWQMENDTVTVTIENSRPEELGNIWISVFSKTPVILIECFADNLPVTELDSDSAFGTIFSEMFTYRWQLPAINENVILTYYSLSAEPYYFNWHAGIPFAMYGYVDVCCRLRGDINHSGDGIIDITDLTMLIYYMFLNGSSPYCQEEADVNGNGSEIIDVSDLLFLINYLFLGASEPPRCGVEVGDYR
ncbi:MAG: dockerin type I domain-containing protein [candidate division Zixibacteria bacterium]|nr:dockerin type I domain-containing protein [candidate division Zixibacteria bacterium]